MEEGLSESIASRWQLLNRSVFSVLLATHHQQPFSRMFDVKMTASVSEPLFLRMCPPFEDINTTATGDTQRHRGRYPC